MYRNKVKNTQSWGVKPTSSYLLSQENPVKIQGWGKDTWSFLHWDGAIFISAVTELLVWSLQKAYLPWHVVSSDVPCLSKQWGITEMGRGNACQVAFWELKWLSRRPLNFETGSGGAHPTVIPNLVEIFYLVLVLLCMWGAWLVEGTHSHPDKTSPGS